MSLIYTAPPPPGSTKRHSLYLGGKAEAKSRSQLSRWGVTHILNVTPEKETGVQSGVPNYFENAPGPNRIIYKRVPVYDASTSDLFSQADSIVGFISGGLHHGSVLVHCKLGVSRSATCIMFFLMRKLGMTFDEATALCIQRKPDIDPIPAFVMQLRKYEAKCRKLGVIRDGSDEGGGETKKRKAAPGGPSIGPARGPTIGPAVGPSPADSRNTESDGEAKESYGGRAHKKARGADAGPSVSNREAETIGPMIGPSIGAAIGPAIGPRMAPQGCEATGDATACIGPALPPTKHSSGSGSVQESTGPIGPSLPPSSCTTKSTDRSSDEKA